MILEKTQAKIKKKTQEPATPVELAEKFPKKPDIYLPLSITYFLPGCNYRPGHYSSSGKVQAFGHPKEICQQEVWQDLRVPRANIESRGRHGFRELLNLT